MPVEWVHLGLDEILVASVDGAWIQHRELGALAPIGPMPSSLAGTPETTRHLLDGAIAAAELAAPEPGDRPVTPRWWAWQLVSQWYISHHTVALHAVVAERYREMGRNELAEFAHHKLAEEYGHEQFPLADLRALGYDAEAVVNEVAPEPAAVELIEYARECVGGEHPVEFLGYGHGIERHVIRADAACFAVLRATLPPGVDAASALRHHATDLDVEHVRQAIEFFSGLPAEDRTRIALGCHRTAQIRRAVRPGENPSESELETWLGRFRTQLGNREQGAMR